MNISRTALSALSATAAIVLVATPAHAAEANEGVWDTGDTHVACGTGVNSRTCTYDFWSAGCTEASAGGVQVAGCSFYLRVKVTVVPLLNGAGRVVGCTSAALSATGFGRYDSMFGQFDNFDMDDSLVFEVKDAFGDGKPGAAKFTIVDGFGNEGSTTGWIAKGALVTSCARGASQWNSGGAGSVTVEI